MTSMTIPCSAFLKSFRS